MAAMAVVTLCLPGIRFQVKGICRPEFGVERTDAPYFD